MDNWFKWLLSVVCGAIATFYEQYGLLIVFVCLAIVFDCVTGLFKAKTIGEGLSSAKGWKGFWKKIALPFALIICCYIVLNECISIAENLYLINPDIMPKWIANLLKVAKDKIEDNNKD